MHLGSGKFVDAETIEVGGKKVKFNKAVVATGGKPRIPQIPGLDQIEFHTSETIFNLTEQPKDLLIVGCGPIGCELGQTFARLGTNVLMSEVGPHFLPRDDEDCVKYLQESMLKDGVKMLFKTKPEMF